MQEEQSTTERKGPPKPRGMEREHTWLRGTAYGHLAAPTALNHGSLHHEVCYSDSMPEIVFTSAGRVNYLSSREMRSVGSSRRVDAGIPLLTGLSATSLINPTELNAVPEECWSVGICTINYP